ncbi:NAD(P)H-binding protein [Streptomyces sp. F001]|uniref:NAD(P)H-binding protein n=1 Tax=Streptomyces sp. F001 TaxID=1510026 RepID=UPI001F1165F8|nr:NAD(P)H-binding protein [Streptomyces sp. F001]
MRLSPVRARGGARLALAGCLLRPSEADVPHVLRSIYANKEIADNSIRSSGLDWTVVYPTRLTHGPAKGTYRADDRLPMKGNPTISRADGAAFMHQAAHGNEWIHRTAVISD